MSKDDPMLRTDSNAEATRFKSPEEALAWQKKRAGKTFSVPVYKSEDGTKVGEFVING